MPAPRARVKKRAAILTAVLAATSASADTGKTPASVLDSPADRPVAGAIDKAVFGRLAKLGIQPAKVCSDGVFVRRAYFDVIGTLPTEAEAREFLLSRSADKRRALIDHLLGRKEFAVYWALKWGDVLRVKAEFPINLWPNAVQAYHAWLWEALTDNMPYDRFVREQLTSSGSNFRVPPVNFYRATRSKEPEAIAKTVALTFMGTRAGKWKQDRLKGMAGFFSYVGYKRTQEWKEEVVFFDVIKASKDSAAGAPMTAVFPDGTRVKLSPDTDPRGVFADWLVTPKNPWFARSIVNRVWSWLAGRGIVHEPDDIRPDNPPSNPELLNALAGELVAAKYDLKHLYRLILNSKTYQLSAVPRSDHPDAEPNFACYPIRPLGAEVLIDALCQITGTTEAYSSRIPEPFTWIPEHHRTIALADGSITSPFLEMFGRPARDTGLESERSDRPTAAQRLHLLNSSHVLQKVHNSAKLLPLYQSAEGGLRTAATRVYLTVLSRFPTETELKTVEAYSQGEETKGEKALIDLAWALINSSEFLYRH